MKLHCLPGACSLAGHIVLEWIGQPYEAVMMSRDSLKSPEYLARNPAGSVPMLEDEDGWVLTQNVAVLHYLAELHPQAALAGEGPRGRAEVNRWLGLVNSDLHKAFLPLFAPGYITADEGQHEALRESARRNVRTLLERIERHLAGRHWLAGERRSIADPYLYVTLRWAHTTGVDLSGLDNLAAFAARMEEDAGVRRALAAEGLKPVASA